MNPPCFMVNHQVCMASCWRWFYYHWALNIPLIFQNWWPNQHSMTWAKYIAHTSSGASSGSSSGVPSVFEAAAASSHHELDDASRYMLWNSQSSFLIIQWLMARHDWKHLIHLIHLSTGQQWPIVIDYCGQQSSVKTKNKNAIKAINQNRITLCKCSEDFHWPAQWSAPNRRFKFWLQHAATHAPG